MSEFGRAPMKVRIEGTTRSVASLRVSFLFVPFLWTIKEKGLAAICQDEKKIYLKGCETFTKP